MAPHALGYIAQQSGAREPSETRLRKAPDQAAGDDVEVEARLRAIVKAQGRPDTLIGDGRGELRGDRDFDAGAGIEGLRHVFDARERVVAMEFVARRSFDWGVVKPFLGLGGFLGVHDMPYTIYNPSSGALAHGQYAGYIIGAVGGGGICYYWVCGETFYYRGFGTQGYPISKSWIVPMLTVKVEF